ncbi:anti-virulence regulator CigR family protein [Pseudomonas sp.]|uniref:anti-virulence regulator CigR family protein n=1 Tax=Pseudomonas sp. TaxID=306 RepID=UPI002C6F23A2|nr:anti-virulence regulator CigR family protein [Pseudomonas sp.]HUE93225.1 anti-virulence regulator CigR family protein [Pseudomonas sp.]
MRRLPRALLIVAALTVALATQSALAAPKADHPGKSGGAHDQREQDVGVSIQGPSIDIGRVRIVLGENRNLIGPSSALPPGIAKNLARGKPLPPGIAKNFDSRVAGQLPRYEGYEWKQVGTDVVLVAIATGIVYEVLRNILD